MTAVGSLAAGRDDLPVIGTAAARRIGWRDLAWVTWHQHRALLIASALVTATVCGVLLTYAAMFHHYAGCYGSDGYGVGSCANSYLVSARNVADVMRSLVFLPALAGAFWGAPLVAREIESGTITLVFGQDVSPRRWLAGKVTVLSTILVCLALAIAVCARTAIPTRKQDVSTYFGSGFDTKIFETGPLTFAGYAVFAFALGIAVGAVVQRTLPSVAVAGAGFFAFWYLLRTVRPHYLPARLVTVRWDATSSTGNGWVLHSVGHGDHTTRVTYTYQPANRLHWLELIECGICVAAGGCLLLIALALLRRRRTTA